MNVVVLIDGCQTALQKTFPLAAAVCLVLQMAVHCQENLSPVEWWLPLANAVPSSNYQQGSIAPTSAAHLSLEWDICCLNSWHLCSFHFYMLINSSNYECANSWLSCGLIVFARYEVFLFQACCAHNSCLIPVCLYVCLTLFSLYV